MPPSNLHGVTRPIMAVYGDAACRAAKSSDLQLYNYEKITLPAERRAPVACDFSALPARLRARPVVIWPKPGADGRALAHADAAALAQGFASAVGVVDPWDKLDDFTLGDALPDGVDPEDVRTAADVALDDAVARALPAQVGGRAVAPWPEPLNASAMFGDARALLARYLAEPHVVLDAIVLWCLHAWCVHREGDTVFDVSPRLVLQANDARADHARALRLAAWLAPSPRIASRAVALHLLPAIGREHPTLLFDDVVGAILYRREMRALITAGATRDSAFLIGARGQAYSPWAECFAPAAVATAVRVPEDMRARAIVVPMSPVPAGDARERLTAGTPPEAVLTLRAQMSAFAADFCAPDDVDAAMPRAIGAQARENWHPLFAVAAAIGTRATQSAIEAAKALAGTEPAPSSNLALLRDIRDLIRVDADARIPTAQLIDALCSDPERAWASARRGRKLDARDLAERLVGFGVKPRVVRLPKDEIARGYHGEDLLNAFARYLNDASARERMTEARDAVTNAGVVTAA